jgi:hypothetical protein
MMQRQNKRQTINKDKLNDVERIQNVGERADEAYFFSISIHLAKLVNISTE